MSSDDIEDLVSRRRPALPASVQLTGPTIERNYEICLQKSGRADIEPRSSAPKSLRKRSRWPALKSRRSQRGSRLQGVVLARSTCRDHGELRPSARLRSECRHGETLQMLRCAPKPARRHKEVACATIGAVLPGDFKIKKSKLALRRVHGHALLRPANSASAKSTTASDSSGRRADRQTQRVRQARRLQDRDQAHATAATRLRYGSRPRFHAVTGAPLVMPAMDPVPATCEIASSPS